MDVRSAAAVSPKPFFDAFDLRGCLIGQQVEADPAITVFGYPSECRTTTGAAANPEGVGGGKVLFRRIDSSLPRRPGGTPRKLISPPTVKGILDAYYRRV